jgi:hypothetical protein
VRGPTERAALGKTHCPAHCFAAPGYLASKAPGSQTAPKPSDRSRGCKARALADLFLRRRDQFLKQDRHSVLTAFAAANQDLAPRELNVLDSESQTFDRPHPCANPNLSAHTIEQARLTLDRWSLRKNAAIVCGARNGATVGGRRTGMDWHAEKFGQPIALALSPTTGTCGGHAYRGHDGLPKGVRLVRPTVPPRKTNRGLFIPLVHYTLALTKQIVAGLANCISSYSQEFSNVDESGALPHCTLGA